MRISNGWTLGFKKTLGKIFQPVNFYGRFPEYYYFERGLSPLWNNPPAREEIRILDVGSPKLFGIYLASHYPVTVWLTDISPLNIDEFRWLWKAISAKAAGGVEFGIQDGRRLTFPDGTFDGVYAMSVIEHISGRSGDGRACAEMVRVLQPGGRLAVSVPFGTNYLEQQIRGRKGAAERTANNRLYFFQRIYDPPSLSRRVSEPLRSRLDNQRMITVGRRNLLLVRAIHRLRGLLGENGMALLGFSNPLQSRLCNSAAAGVRRDIFTRLGPLHSLRDIHADFVWTAQKRKRPGAGDRRPGPAGKGTLALLVKPARAK